MVDANETADEYFPLRRAVPRPTPGLLHVWTGHAPAYATHALASAPKQIGRDPACDIALADQAVSRRHAEVSFDESTGALVLRDDASTHGVYMNGARISGERRMELASARSILRVGASLFIALADINPFVEDLKTRSSLYDAAEDAVIGPAMLAVRKKIREAAKLSRPLLILGDSGSGKERLARYYHASGPRSHAPYLARNCANFQASLAEAELFGYARGAFTGAERNKKGLFELADCGVLFLDEVAELSLEVQSKLLRAAEDGWIYPVSSEEGIRVDVALVAATHADLEKLVTMGKFRQDLYERLRARRVTVPALDERLEEVPFLIELFRAGVPDAPPASALFVEECLLEHWTGNVRALRTAVDAAAGQAVEDGEEEIYAIPPEAKPLKLAAARSHAGEATGASAAAAPPDVKPVVRTPREIKDAEFAALVEKHGGNVVAAAKEKGISESAGYATLARHRGRNGPRGD